MSTGWANHPPRKFQNGAWVKDTTEKTWMVVSATCNFERVWMCKRGGFERIWWPEDALEAATPTRADVEKHNQYVERLVKKAESQRIEDVDAYLSALPVSVQ